MNSTEKLRRILVPSIIILSIFSLAICWITQGCAQQSAKNNAQAATSSLNVTVPLNSPPSQPQPQQPPSQQPFGQQPVPILDLEKQLLDFQNTLSQCAKDHQMFLEAQEEKHQKFLEFCYGLTSGFLSFCAVLVGIVLTFFHFRSRGVIKQMVDERINADIDSHIAKVIAQTEEKLEIAKTAASVLSDKFTKHLKSLQKEVQNRADTLKAKSHIDNLNIIKLASVIARASVILAEYPSENDEARKINNQRRLTIIQLLKEIQLTWAPTDRTIVIYIGRLFRQLGDYDAAIRELDDVIQKRIAGRENKDQNYSDILFNKACYLNVKARGSTGETIELLREQAWKTITEAVKIWYPNLNQAKTDDDLKDLPSPTRDWKNLEPQTPPK